MKRILFVCFCLLFAMAPLMAQEYNRMDDQGRRQGKWCDFFPNGQKRYEGQFKNGKCIGEFRYYDEQGNLKATNEFDKSGTKALNKTYAPNGRVIATGNYLNQQKDGEWRYYEPATGHLIMTEEYKEGKADGWSRLYNPGTERVAEEMQYVAGLREGICRQYFDTGYLMMECVYHDDMKQGLSKSYYPNTMLKEEGEYRNDQKAGQWKTYNEEGDLISVDAYGEVERMNNLPDLR